MILYTRCDAAKISENLKVLYAYINDPKNKMGDALIEKIDDIVDKYNGSEWKRMQMMLEENTSGMKNIWRGKTAGRKVCEMVEKTAEIKAKEKLL